MKVYVTRFMHSDTQEWFFTRAEAEADREDALSQDPDDDSEMDMNSVQVIEVDIPTEHPAALMDWLNEYVWQHKPHPHYDPPDFEDRFPSPRLVK